MPDLDIAFYVLGGIALVLVFVLAFLIFKKDNEQVETKKEEIVSQNIEVKEEKTEVVSTSSQNNKNVEESEAMNEEKKERQTNYHVALNNGKWRVKREGATRALKTFDTQQEAIDFATEKAKNQGNSVVIHKTDGKIRKQNY